MSGSIVPVAPGPPVKVSGSNIDDITLYNMDTVNAMWVGNSPSVAPNSGMRIGPLGTARWSKNSGLAYACVDTGVASTISLNISNDISDPANPVDVATATAIALLAQGIPNVLVTKALLQTVLAANSNTVLDVSGQASVRITILGKTVNQNVLLNVAMYNSTFNPINPASVASRTLTLTSPPTFGPQSTNVAVASWEIPINDSTQMAIGLPAGNPSIAIEVIGSNRLVHGIRQLGEVIPRQFGCNVTFVAGTPVTLTPTDNSSDLLSRYNGPVTLHVQCGSANSINAAGFYLNAAYASPNSVGAGALASATMLPVVTNTSMIAWNHPSIPVSWTVYPNFSAAGIIIVLTIMPAGSGF